MRPNIRENQSRSNVLTYLDDDSWIRGSSKRFDLGKNKKRQSVRWQRKKGINYSEDNSFQ